MIVRSLMKYIPLVQISVLARAVADGCYLARLAFSAAPVAKSGEQSTKTTGFAKIAALNFGCDWWAG